jgi:hypothetical protein
MNTLTLPEDGDLHVIPSTETKRHIKSPSCWCGPSEEEPGIWLHTTRPDGKVLNVVERKP